MNKELLYRFFEGCSSIEEMKQIKAWAEASEENRKLFLYERKLFNTLLIVGSSRKTEQRANPKLKKHVIGEFLKIASIIVLTACLTATLFIEQKSTDADVALQTLIVPAGQRVNLTLPDGSNVWLNANTTLTYPTSFMKDKREVTLNGEAYFEVSHNLKRPFVVHTDKMDIEVLGTTFNVEAYAAKGIFETSLMEGKVAIKATADTVNSIILSPNHKATLIGGQFVTDKIDDYNVYKWREGLYCFKNKPFADVLKDLEKYYDLEIRIDNARIEPVALTGKFRISDGLDYALRVLKQDIYFTYYRDKENDIVYIE